MTSPDNSLVTVTDPAIATDSAITTQAASMSPSYLDRFGGIGRLYGAVGLQRLYDAHVCVIGIGGVGSWAAEALARSGVGKITLIDMDDICVTNTNRQIHAMTSSVGKLKCEAVAERLRDINPEIDVDARMAFVTASNLEEQITPDMDYVIDCIDSVKNKAALIAFCKRRKIRIVTTGAAGGQTDPTQIQVGDLNKTFNDPLARKVRSLLRRNITSRGINRVTTPFLVCSRQNNWCTQAVTGRSAKPRHLQERALALIAILALVQPLW